MHILVCSPGWPTIQTIDFVFVEQLCRAFADIGHRVTVIAPQSLTKCVIRHIPISKYHYTMKTKSGNMVEVFRPYTITFGNSTLSIRLGTYDQAVRRVFKSLKEKPDICYGHFWNCIFALYPLARLNGIPLFGASGEENVSYYVRRTARYIDVVREYVSGVVSVSTKNQRECLELNLITPEKSVVIPNAIDQSIFHKLEKKNCRSFLKLPQDVFIVTFVGQFVSRKGVMVLNEALKRIGDEQIKAIFIGSGLEDPDYVGIIHKGRVAHDDVPKWLNAADVFVLPTENEGCCNAIIEAMACGLPVISTDAPFNYDILNERNSILVDSHDIDAIASAIKTLKDNPNRCDEMSTWALKTSEGLRIDKRAERIIEFINKQKQQ